MSRTKQLNPAGCAILLSCCGVLAGLLASCASSDPGPAPAHLQQLVTDQNRFAVDFYQQVQGSEGNLFFSPASLSTALGMTYAGARGQTAQQMAQAMRFDLPPEQLHPAFAWLVRDLNGAGGSRGYTLDVANALWGQKGYAFVPSFNQLLETDYGAALHPLDFSASPEASRRTINQWVEQHTHNKIKDLIPSGALDQYTRLVLTNAIYFKGKWDRQFKTEQTRPQPFKLSDGKTVDVPMMHQMKGFRLLQGDGFAALEMPYVGGDLSMVVFLPEKADGLGAFEKQITADRLAGWIDSMHKATPTDVVVTFPKFTFTRSIALKPILSRMGMPLAFSREADFSGMNGGKEPLYISDAFHQAFVKVDEEGTEAAAATGVGMAAASVRVAPAFTADHPFVFVIRQNLTGSILFMGRVVSPQSE
jgi:serpin B